ncbi:unnamed protein product [Heligmosomoides polygyrus]|uniref:DUF5641 domain-containing protein n=1 Tax=Heligmosomoides polygyrus TaxID=6339 RepID=A0A183GFJ4_HELPZ|nr:unnamed protein product [Heligmosomoides polygyrus]
MDSKRGTSAKPKIGTVVLLWEPSQPRNTWNVGRIVELGSHSSEAVREVVVELPNKNQIRRPVNRVIPLEIGAEDEEVRKLSSTDPHPQNPETVTTDLPGGSRYNLRKRKKLQYCEDTEDQSDFTVGPVYQANPIRKLPLLLAILSLFTTGTIASNNSSEGYHIQCMDDGVKLTQDSSNPYEICAETHCVSFPSPRQTELVKFPPQITLHDYSVKWKTTHEANFDVIEVTCKSTPFCRNIDCTICVANIANPECWPLSAAVGMGLAVYIILMMCYMFFAVPVILGNPLLRLLRILGVLVALATRTTFDLCFRTIPRIISRAIGNFSRRQQQRRRRRIWLELAILMATFSRAALGCQECGKRHTLFEMNGILHYTGSMEMAVRRLVNGESEVISEFNLPDLSHIFDVFLNWSRTLLLVIIVVGAAVATSYFIIMNGFFYFFMKTVLRLFYCLARFVFRVLHALACSPLRLFYQRTKEDYVKTGEKQL